MAAPNLGISREMRHSREDLCRQFCRYYRLVDGRIADSHSWIAIYTPPFRHILPNMNSIGNEIDVS
jgi:hypothetical protein